MGKAILAAIVTLIVGYLGIAVMGAFIIYFNDKK